MAQRQVIEKHYPENTRTEVFRTLMLEPIDGIPEIYSITETGDGFTVTEEYIPGRTLAEVMQGDLFKRREAVRTCIDLCDILEELHSRGIVHGDIKPENIIISSSGKLYLIDLDASHFVKEDVGRDTVMMGTPGYASPEQFGFGRSDPRSDIYAVGILLNIMMTGQHPLYNMVSGNMSVVVKKCTDVDPERRYRNVRELKKALKHPREAHEFLPVGFRSGNPGKMFLAIVGYGFWGFMVYSIASNAKGRNAVNTYLSLGWLTAIFLGTLAIFFNYGGINEIFSRNKDSDHIVAKVVEEIIYVLLVTILVSAIAQKIK